MEEQEAQQQQSGIVAVATSEGVQQQVHTIHMSRDTAFPTRLLVHIAKTQNGQHLHTF